MADELRFLHIEDDLLDAEQIESMLRAEWPECFYSLIKSEDELRDALANSAFDIILADYSLPGFDGMTAMAIANQLSHGTPVVFVTGTMGEETAIEALKNGATDYVLKTNLSRFIPAVERALKDSKDARTRLKLEKQIIRASEEWQSTFDAIQDSVTLIDSEQRIIRCNRSTCQKLQLDFPEILNQYCWKVFHCTEAAIPDCPMIKSKVSHQSETANIQQDGKWLEISVDPILSEQGTMAAAVHIVRDVTDKKHSEQKRMILEQQFQQAQKLESLGVLAGGIAHDFNNILTVIICNCTLLKKHPQLLDELATEIETAAQRAAELCRQMLVYAGKSQPISEKVNITALTDEMVKMLKSSIPQNISISYEAAPEIPRIPADGSQIRQVLMNLIINAAEAIGIAPGAISLTLGTSEFSAEAPVADHLGKPIAPGSYICLTVTDNGCGMNEETIRRVFEPFYTTKSTGRGLGMSAILGIIQAHQGALQLSSQPGAGTTFKVYLPLLAADSNHENATQTPSPAHWQGSGTVLLVEDEPQVMLVGRMLLKELGFSVIEATNGKEALELYQRNAEYITLVMTDIGMPVMDGYELLRELKKLDPGLTVITCSGFGDTEYLSLKKEDSVAGHLNKPYRFDQLQELLKSVLDGKSSK